MKYLARGDQSTTYVTEFGFYLIAEVFGRNRNAYIWIRKRPPRKHVV